MEHLDGRLLQKYWRCRIPVFRQKKVVNLQFSFEYKNYIIYTQEIIHIFLITLFNPIILHIKRKILNVENTFLIRTANNNFIKYKKSTLYLKFLNLWETIYWLYFIFNYIYCIESSTSFFLFLQITKH